jgi:hypothetical protein
LQLGSGFDLYHQEFPESLSGKTAKSICKSVLKKTGLQESQWSYPVIKKFVNAFFYQ